jgi:hypothetical protein
VGVPAWQLNANSTWGWTTITTGKCGSG